MLVEKEHKSRSSTKCSLLFREFPFDLIYIGWIEIKQAIAHLEKSHAFENGTMKTSISNNSSHKDKKKLLPSQYNKKKKTNTIMKIRAAVWDSFGSTFSTMNQLPTYFY